MVKSEGIPQKKWCPTTKKEKKREREREREREEELQQKRSAEPTKRTALCIIQ